MTTHPSIERMAKALADQIDEEVLEQAIKERTGMDSEKEKGKEAPKTSGIMKEQAFLYATYNFCEDKMHFRIQVREKFLVFDTYTDLKTVGLALKLLLLGVFAKEEKEKVEE